MEAPVDSDQDQEQKQHIDWLDEFNDYIERALAGIFFFLFKKIPQWFWHVLSTAFAWLFVEIPSKLFQWFKQSANFILRLGWTLLMLLSWVVISFGPLTASFFLHKFQTGAVIWLILAVTGSVWGLMSLRRQQIRSAIGRLASKLRFWQNPIST